MSDLTRMIAPAVIREALKNGLCPWCDAGPFKMVAGHISRTHGLSSRELRIRAEIRMEESICDPEYSDRLRQILQDSNRHESLPRTPKGFKWAITPGGRRSKYGDGNGGITAERARLLRALHASEPTLTHRELANRFGVSRSHVTDILRGRRWQGV